MVCAPVCVCVAHICNFRVIQSYIKAQDNSNTAFSSLMEISARCKHTEVPKWAEAESWNALLWGVTTALASSLFPTDPGLQIPPHQGPLCSLSPLEAWRHRSACPARLSSRPTMLSSPALTLLALTLLARQASRGLCTPKHTVWPGKLFCSPSGPCSAGLQRAGSHAPDGGAGRHGTSQGGHKSPELLPRGQQDAPGLGSQQSSGAPAPWPSIPRLNRCLGQPPPPVTHLTSEELSKYLGSKDGASWPRQALTWKKLVPGL